MEDNKNDKLPDETSKVDDKVNVNPDGGDGGDKPAVTPDPGNSTTPSPKPTEPSKDTTPSKDDANVQQAIQKHAELREEEKRKREEAEEKLQKAEEEKQQLLEVIESNKKANLETAVKNRIASSNLPEGLKARIGKDPVKWVLNNAENAPQGEQDVDETTKFVSESLDNLVKVWETELGVTTSPKATFVDSDNVSIQTPGKNITAADLKNMTPYEIQKLPKDVKEKLLSAGSKLEI